MNEFITPHFKWSEFASRGIPVPEEYHENITTLCTALEVIRSYLGDQPITIVSGGGWRHPGHNKSTGQATDSQHLYGRAADIRVKGHTPKAVYNAINKLVNSKAIPTGGLHCYDTFVHYDIRGRKARW